MSCKNGPLEACVPSQRAKDFRGLKRAMSKKKETQTEQSKRFVETARKLGVDEAKTGPEKAFGKLGLGKPKKKSRRK